jgi:hypothetical protein
MKAVWLWIIFFLAYAVFSMKTHAAALTAHPELAGTEFPRVSLCQAR